MKFQTDRKTNKNLQWIQSHTDTKNPVDTTHYIEVVDGVMMATDGTGMAIIESPFDMPVGRYKFVKKIKLADKTVEFERVGEPKRLVEIVRRVGKFDAKNYCTLPEDIHRTLKAFKNHEFADVKMSNGELEIKANALRFKIQDNYPVNVFRLKSKQDVESVGSFVTLLNVAKFAKMLKGLTGEVKMSVTKNDVVIFKNSTKTGLLMPMVRPE